VNGSRLTARWRSLLDHLGKEAVQADVVAA
jgi:hypothetical protein